MCGFPPHPVKRKRKSLLHYLVSLMLIDSHMYVGGKVDALKTSWV